MKTRLDQELVVTGIAFTVVAALLFIATVMFLNDREAVTTVGRYLEVVEDAKQKDRIQEARADLWRAENCEPNLLFLSSYCNLDNPYR